jgi:hypothetical protein
MYVIRKVFEKSGCESGKTTAGTDVGDIGLNLLFSDPPNPFISK